MRFFGSLLSGRVACCIFALTLTSPLALAQTEARAQDANAYRAEIVLIERKMDAGDVTEKMASRHPDQNATAEKRLWVVGRDGQRQSDLTLVPRNEMYLNSAIQRLERSGRFNVLMSAGWYQSFPPDYKGEPLRIEVGDWLGEANQREIEGNISIERLRFLHVTAALNHWQPAPMNTMTPAPESRLNNGGDGESSSVGTDAMGDLVLSGGAMMGDESVTAPQPGSLTELVTWIRETRRMRSEEIHFLDSPTIGILIFFKKVEDDESDGSGA